jgi:hypothetical protein
MHLQSPPAHLRTYEDYGRYFGYPECCIAWFSAYAGSRLTPKQSACHHNRGFIPCPACAETVTGDTLHTLIADRQCPTPFPEDGF